MPLEHPLLQRDAASGQRLALAVLAVKFLKLRPPPLAGVLRIPEASRILVLADFLKVVILHLTALLLVLFLAAYIRFLPLLVLPCLNYINLSCYQCSKLHSHTPSPQSSPPQGTWVIGACPYPRPPPSVTPADQPPSLWNRHSHSRHPFPLSPCLSFRLPMRKGAAPKRDPFRAGISLRVIAQLCLIKSGLCDA